MCYSIKSIFVLRCMDESIWNYEYRLTLKRNSNTSVEGKDRRVGKIWNNKYEELD